MSLSQPEFEALLGRLREHQTESPKAEGKVNLSLVTEGDRAYFLRHIAALANNVQPSYLIIGVENKTWNPIGLAKDSPLREPDATQQRMNQILGKRLDPTLTVRYRTYEADGVVYGLVSIDGSRAPYIVAIQSSRPVFHNRLFSSTPLLLTAAC
jgi:predicted HTH transcriptional regulator